MIIVIGGANVDISGVPMTNTLIFKDSNPGKVIMGLGGVGRNIGENLCWLGQETCFLGVVGGDDYGEYIIKESSKSGLNMSNVKRVEDRLSAVYVCILDETGDMAVAVCETGITDEINQQYIKKMAQIFNKAELLIIDGNLKENQIGWIVDSFKQVPILYDPVSSAKAINGKKFVGRFHSIKPNRLEAEVLAGFSIQSEEDLAKACQLFHSWGTKEVYISMGLDGTYYSDGQVSGKIKAGKATVVNATGAGDAFVAGIAYGIVNGFNIEKTTIFATLCARETVKCEKAITKLDANRIIKEINHDTH